MTTERRHTWDAAVYERFAAQRERPVTDLLAQVRPEAPRLVVDLGCGSGASTRPLARRWPEATVIGVDSSAQMLARAAELGAEMREGDPAARIEWVEADLTAWEPPAGMDVVLTNAALQWIPGHLDLLPRWIDALAPGGWFAVQVPGNADAPNHVLLRDVVAALPEAQDLLPALLDKAGVADPAGYAQALHAAGCAEVDAWETTYLHILDPDARQESPVLEWMRGTGLRPVLGKLPPDREADLLARYAAALAEAYPRTAMGVAFPFRRVFAVGRREGPGTAC